MKIWILKRAPIAQPNAGPNQVDIAEGFVVRAADRKTARKLAGEQAGDEGADFWSDPERSTCTQIRHDRGDPGVLLRDFRAG